jgi:hypothetical protein
MSNYPQDKFMAPNFSGNISIITPSGVISQVISYLYRFLLVNLLKIQELLFGVMKNYKI